MWTSTSMAVPESVLLSVMGLGVVMVTLITLALVILLFSKVMGSGASRVTGRDQRHQHQRIKVKQAHNRRLQK